MGRSVVNLQLPPAAQNGEFACLDELNKKNIKRVCSFPLFNICK